MASSSTEFKEALALFRKHVEKEVPDGITTRIEIVDGPGDGYFNVEALEGDRIVHKREKVHLDPAWGEAGTRRLAEWFAHEVNYAVERRDSRR